MSTFLYRLGRWCASHAWRAIAVWVAVLAIVGGLAATIGQPLTSKVSIPGSDFEKVLTQLGKTIPAAAGGSGRVVIEAPEGGFTDAQKAAVGDAITAWEGVPHVTGATNPFEAQAQLDSGAQTLAQTRAKLDEATQQAAAGATRLEQAKQQVVQAEAQLAQLKTADPSDPRIPAIEAQVAQGKAQVAQGEAKAAEGAKQLQAGEQQYTDGKALQDAAAGIRLVSEDGRYAIVQIQFDDDTQSVPSEDRAQIPVRGDPILEAAGLTPHYSMEITNEIALVGPGEILGLLVAIIVLVIMLGTLVAAGLPVLVALFGVGVGLGGAMALTSVVSLNETTPALALMLGLAVGIDYALFIVNRHRTNLLQGMSVVEAAARANATAGGAVTFAGSTVVIALGALLVTGIPILAQMGLVAAATVAIAVMVAVTLSPAVLRLMGTRVLSKRAWAKHGYAVPGDPGSRTVIEEDVEERHGDWYVTLATGKPWLTVLGVVALLGVIAVPALDMRLGLPDGGNEAAGSSAFQTYDIIGTQFGPGANGPIIAMATLPAAGTARSEADVLHEQATIATALRSVEGVVSVVPIGVSDDTQTLAFQIVPTSGPNAAETPVTLDRLKAEAVALESGRDLTIGFTGQTVANVEVSDKLGAALPLYLAVVVGLSLLILMAVFRSLVVPLIATGGFLLSVAAAFGATVAVYQWGWLGSVFQVSNPGALLSFMPTILIGVLFGLAMDYQMFLVSGMHEAYAHGAEARSAVRIGFSHGAKVVTAAALIMTSVFAGFAFSHLTMVRPIGFGLAVGVIVDAVLVRMTLTPALMHLLGDRAWYLPRWLGRILPDLDVEGTKLADRIKDGSLGHEPSEESEPEPATT